MKVHRRIRPTLHAALLATLLGCQADSVPVPDPASAPPAAAATDTADADILRPDGWRDLRIGMTRAEVVAVAGEDANPEAVGGPDPATCDEFRPESAPDGLMLMIRNDRLSRIAITGGAGIETALGIGIGAMIDDVREAHGSTIVAAPHAYHAEPAAYLTVWQTAPPSPDARGIVYEVGSDRRVLRILGGDESIQFVEGCV